MASLLVRVLLCLVLVDDDLLSLALFQDFAYDRSTLYNGLTDLDTIFRSDSQNFIDSYGFSNLSVQLFYVDDIAFCDLLLLSAGLDNCIHDFLPPLIRARQYRWF